MPTMTNCPHSGDGWCLACVQALDRERRELLGSLRNLLAVVHRDGGHHSAEHGAKASAEMGEEVVAKDRSRLSEAMDALLQIEQAGHNPADLFPDLIGQPDRYYTVTLRLAAIANDAIVKDRRAGGEYARQTEPRVEQQRSVPDA